LLDGLTLSADIELARWTNRGALAKQ